MDLKGKYCLGNVKGGVKYCDERRQVSWSENLVWGGLI